MIDPDMRNAIFQLHTEGMSQREISRRLHVSRNAVRRIVKQQGKLARQERSDKKQVDAALLERLYHECDGWVQRIHEKLVEEEEIEVSYPTLTRLLRELGISKTKNVRCDRVPDEPGHFFRRRLADPEPELEILPHRHVGVEGVALEHHSDISILGRNVIDDAVVDGNGALADLLQTCQHAQAGRLTGTVRPDEAENLSGKDLQLQPIDCCELSEFLGQPVGADGRLRWH